MNFLYPVIVGTLLFAVGNVVFRRYNMGLARNSKGQQFRRYLIAAVQSVIPLCVAGTHSFADIPEAVAMLTSLLWIGTYNILYDKTHRPSSPDYDNHMDIAFGIYLYGWLTALHFLLSWLSPVAAAVVVGVVEVVLIIIPLAEIVYYVTYKVCIDDAGMAPLLNTYFSEAVEFVKSFGIAKAVATAVTVVLILACCMIANACHDYPDTQLWQIALVAAVFIYFSIYIYGSRGTDFSCAAER